MKKTLLSLAAVVVPLSASAAPIVIKANPNAATVAANTVLTDNEFITATTMAESSGGKSGSAYVFGDVDLTDAGYFQLRSNAPTEDDPWGVSYGSSCTSVKVEVKKPVTIYCYVRTGDNKQTAVKVYNSTFDVMPYANGAEEGKNCALDGSNVMWEFSWTLGAGTYCLTETGGTGRMAGLGYEEAEDPGTPEDPAEGEEITFNLADYSKWGKPEQNVTAKGTVIYNEEDKTYTFPNFLGSKTDVTFAIEAVEGSTLFKVVPQNNVVVGTGDYYGAPTDTYTFPGLESNNSIWFGLDGVNSVCFSNPTFYGYKASSASKEAEKLVDTPTSANDYRYYYAVSFYIASNYCDWNPATSAAGEVSTTPGSFNLKFNLEIPASDDQSGIDSIVTDSADENAPVEYYNLQGIRLSEPAAGQIVIRRQGSKVSKIVVR